MPYFYIKYIYIKKPENTLPELLLLFYSIEPQMSTIHWFGFFFKQKKVKLCMVYVILKLKEKDGLLKLYISFTIKQNIFQYNLYYQGSRLTLESSGTST